jgi:hypothetical protein
MTMSVLLITYDFIRPSPAIKAILGIVNQYKHIQLAEGSYAIETDEKTRTVFNKFLPCLGEHVHLLVATLIKPFSGTVSGPVSDWLTKHLTEY